MDAEGAYLFRHGVLRDAAYDLMPPSFRATLHARPLWGGQLVRPWQAGSLPHGVVRFDGCFWGFYLHTADSQPFRRR